MKVLWLSSALLLLGVGIAGILDTPVLKFSEATDSEPVLELLAKHQHAQVQFIENRSTGYNWFRVMSSEKQECSPRMKEIKRYHESPAGSSRMGASGILRIQYEALLEGEEEFVFAYSRVQPTMENLYENAKVIKKFKIIVRGNMDKPPCN